MIKNNLKHSHLKVRSACKKLKIAIDENPDFFKGLKIPDANVSPLVANDRHLPFRNVSIAGLLLAFFVKVFH